MHTVGNIQFAQWLEEETKKRGWSYRELGRRANLSSGAVSQVLTLKAFPGNEFCNGVARAFDVPPERVFRLAGILPARVIGNENSDQELLDYFHALDRPGQQQALTIVRALYESRAEYTTDEEADK